MQGSNDFKNNLFILNHRRIGSGHYSWEEVSLDLGTPKPGKAS